MRELLAIGTILAILGVSGIEPSAVQAKTCKTDFVNSVLGGC